MVVENLKQPLLRRSFYLVRSHADVLTVRSFLSHCVIIMPPPSKRVLRLRAAASSRWSSGITPMPDGESKESSDDDIYIIESDIEIDDDAVSKAEAFALKWKAGAKPKHPAVYQKNSRTTKWRKSELQARREASVSDCRRITDFFSKIQQPDNNEILELEVSSQDTTSSDE